MLAFAQRERGEIPFGIDKRGKLYTPKPADLEPLKALDVERLTPRAAGGSPRRTGEWIVVAKRDAGGSIFGIARPIGDSLREIRRASVRNLGLGLGVIVLADVQSREIDAVLAHVEEHVRAFRGDVEPLDDATMMALRVI
ncbi:MAG: hypothetical protein H0W08_18575 [Acidobacteria bacterium]|nr:hypothetical protein [Acidobacteriota bacterium]